MHCDYTYNEALRAHPDGLAQHKRSPRPPWASAIVARPNIRRCRMAAIYREDINQRYQVDGFFTNGTSTGSLTVCYCEACRGASEPHRTTSRGAKTDQHYDASMDQIQQVVTREQQS